MSDTVVIQTRAASVSETKAAVVVRITRSGDLAGDVTIDYGLTADTATAGVDFVGGFGRVVIPDGESQVTVSIPILNDALAEPTEVFSFAIVSVDGATLLAPRTLRVSILDDELPAPPPDEPPLVSEYLLDLVPVTDRIQLPIKFQFLPGEAGTMIVAGNRGLVERVDMATGETTQLLDLSDRVNQSGDRGLLDIAVHPDFPATPYLYVFAAMDPPDSAGRVGNAGLDGSGNRYAQVLRYTLDEATGFTTVVPGSEVVLLGANGQSLDDISGGGVLDYTKPANAAEISSERFINPDAADRTVVIDGFKQDYIKVDSATHVGGALLFGPDGALYVTIGDGTSFNYADPRSVDVLSPDSLSGKVLRVDPETGLGLADNPYVTDGVELDSNRAKVFQSGLRNPYGAGFAPDGRLFLTNTGWFSYEDVFTGPPGANFGWPFFEGQIDGTPIRTPGYREFPEAQAFYDAVDRGEIVITPAFASFGHFVEAPGYAVQAIVGGEAVIDGDAYGAALDGHFLFTDFSERNVFAVDINDPDSVTFLGTTDDPLSHFLQGPDGAIYVADLLGGTVSRLVLDFIRIDGSAAPMLAFAVAEGTAAAFHDFTATDGNGQAVRFEIVGGADAARFTIDPVTGALRFLMAPDFEAPVAAGGANRYAVEVAAIDPDAHRAVATVTVDVTDGAEVLLGSDAAEVLVGTALAERITALGGDDIVQAGDGDDTVVGTDDDGDDSYDGGGGRDTYSLEGTAAAALIRLDRLFAQRGDDERDVLRGFENVIGGAGADRVFGDGGANGLAGGAGRDTLTGGGGDDVFVAVRGGGTDVVRDFSDQAANRDRLDLSDFSFADFAAVLAAARAAGNDMRLVLAPGDVVVLRGFSLARFDADDVLI